MEIMREMGMEIHQIHAGRANMFLSDIFCHTLASTSGATIDLFETDGSAGAARGAGMGCGVYKNHDEAFATLKRLQVVQPETQKQTEYTDAYQRWKEIIN